MRAKVLKRIVFLSLGWSFCFAPASLASTENSTFLEKYPALQEYLFEEPASSFQFGMGVSPFGILRSQMGLNASLFQLHWVTPTFDWEIINASLGISLGSDELTKSRQLTFRTSPKFRIGSFLAAGPLVGYELVSFPSLDSRMASDGFATPVEPFSSRGFIYGVEVSETFSISQSLRFKINQVFYNQTYSVEDAGNGWSYRFPQTGGVRDLSAISPGNVFMLEFSVLY